VITVSVNGAARAYPLGILMSHEIVNDELGGKPIAVTFCPLCNSGVVFDRRVGERLLEFGNTGRIRHADMVMYDRATESWWQQFTGEAIIGSQAGTLLRALPARLEYLAWFRERAPDVKVMIPAGRDVENNVVQKPGPDGVLRDVPYDVTFAFAFQTFRPDGEIIF